MLDIFKYIFFFLGICAAIVLIIALINIYTKSYNPKNSFVVIGSLLLLFIFNGIMAVDALNRSLSNFNNSFNFELNQPKGNSPNDTTKTSNPALF